MSDKFDGPGIERVEEVLTVKVERPLSDEFLSDVMTTMVESGYDSLFYWGTINFMERDDNGAPVVFTVMEDVSQQRHLPHSSVYVIERGEVVRAIQKIIDEKLIGTYLMDYLVRAILDDDAGDVDATVADCILQVACFGKVVYS